MDMELEDVVLVRVIRVVEDGGVVTEEEITELEEGGAELVDPTEDDVGPELEGPALELDVELLGDPEGAVDVEGVEPVTDEDVVEVVEDPLLTVLLSVDTLPLELPLGVLDGEDIEDDSLLDLWTGPLLELVVGMGDVGGGTMLVMISVDVRLVVIVRVVSMEPLDVLALEAEDMLDDDTPVVSDVEAPLDVLLPFGTVELVGEDEALLEDPGVGYVTEVVDSVLEEMLPVEDAELLDSVLVDGVEVVEISVVSEEVVLPETPLVVDEELDGPYPGVVLIEVVGTGEVDELLM